MCCWYTSASYFFEYVDVCWSVWKEECFVGMMRVASWAWTETGADNADENSHCIPL